MTNQETALEYASRKASEAMVYNGEISWLEKEEMRQELIEDMKHAYQLILEKRSPLSAADRKRIVKTMEEFQQRQQREESKNDGNVEATKSAAITALTGPLTPAGLLPGLPLPRYDGKEGKKIQGRWKNITPSQRI